MRSDGRGNEIVVSRIEKDDGRTYFPARRLVKSIRIGTTSPGRRIMD
jgi:hypothetical protein